MVRTVGGQPGSLQAPAGPGTGHAPQARVRKRVALFVRRHRLAPYLLVLPSAAVIAALLLWPTIQIAVFSFQDYGLPQLVGSEPTQWVGLGNYSQILHDPEFWLSLRTSVLFAAVVVPLTLTVGTLVGLLLSKLGRKMAAFVSSVAMLAWATPAVSASVIFVWLADPDGGVVDWFLTKLPPWLDADTDLVSRHTAAAVAGLQGAGVAACTKHFPGHGRTGTDSHQAIATIEGGLTELRQRDLPPFAAAIRAGTIAIMPSHLRVPELTGDMPATLSSAALTGLLRGELGFTGVIVSDALEMRATRDAFGIPGAAVLAVAAGTDLLCLGREGQEDEYLAVRGALVAAVRDGTVPGGRLEEAADRVARLRGGLARAPERSGDGVQPGATQGQGLAAARRAVRMSGPRPALSRPLIIEVEPQENVAAGRFGWGLGPWVPAGSVRRVQLAGEPDGTATGILDAAAGRSLVAVVRDAHRDADTRSLVSALLAARPDTVVVEMGLPLWSPPEGTSYLATYGASRASAQAAAELLGLA
jgi:Glycosyl hydrolase family 3 N terminal domain